MKCRHCRAELSLPFLDLGAAPPVNALLSEAGLRAPETSYPLRVLVCESCWLVQTEDYAAAEALFTADYPYFSSCSTSWLRHSERYVEAMAARFGLGAGSRVVEVAANDGYLLQYVQARGIPCYGIEPTAATAGAARARGLEIVEAFLGLELARELAAAGRQADLLVANNVLAHVPDPNDFVAAIALLLRPGGVATFEFPHLLRLVQENQFDTVYHEHFSYLSLTAVERIFAAGGLRIFDLEELPTHGGSLRVFAESATGAPRPASGSVAALLQREEAAGLRGRAFYQGLQAQAEKVKNDFLAWLLEARRAGLTVAGYGAAAKGTTLLNFAGVRPDLLPYVVDANPAKQGMYLPGSRIPVVAEERLRMERPDRVVVLPWNLAAEIGAQLDYVHAWGGRLIRAVPSLQEVAAEAPRQRA